MSVKIIVLFLLSINWLRVQSNTLQHSSTIKQEMHAKIISSDPERAIRNQPIEYSEYRYIIYNNNNTISIDEKQTPFFHYQPRQLLNVKSVGRKTPRILKEKVNQVAIEITSSLDILANALTQLMYQPVAILVDDTPEIYKSTMFVIDKLADNLNIRTEFWLMKFNSSGVSNVLIQSRANVNGLKKQLSEEMIKSQLQINLEHSEGNTAFFAILKASQILPENSGIIIFSDKKPIDEDLSHLTVNTLIKKNIRVYAVWYGNYSTAGHDEKILEETTIITKGQFFLGHIQTETSIRNSTQLGGVTERKEIIYQKYNIFKDNSIQIQLNSTINSLDITIQGLFLAAVLVSPQGCNADLLNITSVEELSFDMTIAHVQHRLANVRFNTTKVTKAPIVGTWELRITCVPNSHTGYNVTILAETGLFVKSAINFNNKTQVLRNDLNIQVNGQVSLTDLSGYEIRRASYGVIKSVKITKCSISEMDSDIMTKKQIQIINNNMTLPTKSPYSKVSGTNNEGEILSDLNDSIQSRKLPLIIIETSTHSELIVTPGSNPKIIFEVTNNHDQATFLFFACQDEKSLLRDLQPRSSWVGPKQTIEITVYMYVPASAALSFTDLITLTAKGQIKGQKSALLYVSGPQIQDNEKPYLNYKFTSNCMEVSYSSCQSGTWTLEVTAQDSQTGLLKLTSNPFGLYAPNGYITGTKESVTGYYSSTCCQPYLEITAIDLNNNRISYKTDAYHAQLNTGSIIAIVLGAVLLLVIIIIVGLLIRKRYKKRDSLDIPRYRGQVGTTRF